MSLYVHTVCETSIISPYYSSTALNSPAHTDFCTCPGDLEGLAGSFAEHLF